MQNIRDRQHWIFDMDGTLTVGVHDFAMMRRELGLANNVPILEALHQLPEDQTAPLWEKLNAMELHFADLAKPMPGALQLLQWLQNKGAKLGMITRNVMPVAEHTLRTCGLADFFPKETILDRDTCTPKPSPEGLHRLMNYWQAEHSDTVMIGDFLFDLQAGKAADVATIHIDTQGKFAWPEYCDWPVTSLDQISLSA